MAIDDIDLRILDMLQRNGKLSQAKIAGAVGLTTPSVNERIKKMERHGMIKGFVALLDHEKMGLPLTAYIDVALEHPRFEKSFVDDLEIFLRANHIDEIPTPCGIDAARTHEDIIIDFIDAA